MVGDAPEPRRRDGDAVGVAAEIAHDVIGAAEGALGVDDPVGTFGRAHELAAIGLAEVDVARVAEIDEALEKAAAEHLAQCGDGEEEVAVGGLDLLRTVGAEAAAGDDGMQMRMEEQLAGPGVQDEGEADLGAEPFGVGGEGEQGLRDRAKQQPQELAAVGEDDGTQDRWQSEDAVEVGGVEQALIAGLDPAVPRRPLPLRTMRTMRLASMSPTHRQQASATRSPAP